MKTLVLYYSYRGNTKRVAEAIWRATGGDIACIDTVVPYSRDYDTDVEQGKRENDAGFCPELKPLGVDLAAYNAIALGSPVWWYTFASAMRTFLEGADLSGKTVHPFATNAGWPGRTFGDFEKACKAAGAAKVGEGLDVVFDGTVLRTPEASIQSWAEGILR